MVITESIKEIIHGTAAAIRELLQEHMRTNLNDLSQSLSQSFSGRYSHHLNEISEMLSKPETSKSILSAVNAVLKQYGEPSVSSVNGFDILILDDILSEASVCERCRDPRLCPFRGLKLRPKVYVTGIHAREMWCERHYRVYLIDDIQRLAQKEILGLEAKTTRELIEMRDKLKARVKK